MRVLEFLRARRRSPGDRIAEVGVEKGMRVADIGAGYGFYTFPAAAAVGDGGMVYAVEPLPKRAASIAERARRGGVANVRVIVRGAEEIPELATGEVDVAISMSSFHHFGDREKALSELARIVRQGGLVYIRDVKAGRIFRHGSESREFRRTVGRKFPSTEFDEGRGYVAARARV